MDRFAASDRGGEHWPVIASTVETCKLNGVDPQAWRADVITRIVGGIPKSRIDDLLPWASPRVVSRHGRATFKHVINLRVADGEPVSESKPAIMIADVVSDCVLSDDGWLFSSHVLTQIFMGGVRSTVPSRDELLDALEHVGAPGGHGR